MKNKLLQSVKRTMLNLMLALSLPLFAFHSINLPDNRAVIEFRETSLEDVLKKIGQIFTVQFTYSPDIIQNDKKISLVKKERSLKEVLADLEGITSLQFMQVGNMIGVQRAKTISAIITDEDITVRAQ
mgnify:CR=1 FL=1